MAKRTRREFLQESITAGVAGAGLTALASAPVMAQNASSQANVAGANDRIRVGLIGCGGMGRGNLRAMLRAGKVECAALCDVDDEQSGKAAALVEEQGGQRPRLIVRDFRRLLDDKEIDAVIVGTPDHWHALPTIMACQAGKDVYVEKPLSLTIHEGRVMVEAARRYNCVVQMGTQQRSAPHFMEALEYLKSGKLGKIRVVKAWAYQDWMGNIAPVPDSEPPASVDYDLWLGPAPKRPFNKNRFHFNFRWYWDYSGGLMTDWGAHMIDVANWGMGVKAPLSAASVGGKFGFPDDAEETPDTQQAIWNFPAYSMVWEHATAIGRGPEARDHGVAFHGNNGVLVVDRGGWEVHPETERVNGKKSYRAAGVPRQGSGGADFHFLHVKNFLDCMRSRQRPNSDVEIGHNSMIACHLANIAFRLKRQVNWDVEKERVIGDQEAQRLVSKEYRAPWKLPDISSL
ncbi:MAG TPA: Gfo/Idh/MocA family oxidoreductase [Blastocatellia bacterium]|nr:Gfo/Idh/MocA family oxidoreductase [Blastocatellia bacterium]